MMAEQKGVIEVGALRQGFRYDGGGCNDVNACKDTGGF